MELLHSARHCTKCCGWAHVTHSLAQLMTCWIIVVGAQVRAWILSEQGRGGLNAFREETVKYWRSPEKGRIVSWKRCGKGKSEKASWQQWTWLGLEGKWDFDQVTGSHVCVRSEGWDFKWGVLRWRVINVK